MLVVIIGISHNRFSTVYFNFCKLNNKNGILTFVYFIGGNHKDDLEGITDHFISQGGNVKQSLSHYFSAIGLAYKSQKVLSVKPCSGGAYATP